MFQRWKGNKGMKYKLLKDTPTIKAGTIFEEVTSDFDELKELVRITPIGAKTSPEFTIQDIDNFDEWFEEIKEPVNSIHWKPNFGEEYWYVNYIGNVVCRSWEDASVDLWLLESGNVYRTIEEAEKARERRLAEVRLRQTSDFKPDFENGNGGWIVGYDYEDESLTTIPISDVDYGEPVRYATSEDARKSIKENREDWLIYFGVKE